MRGINKDNRLIPAYIQLKQILYAQIQDSEAPEIRLPSIREIMKLHKVSQGTVEKALFELEKEGHIDRRSCLGVYAKPEREAPEESKPAPLGRRKGLVGIQTFDPVNFFPRIVSAAKAVLEDAGYSVIAFSPDAAEAKEGTHFFLELLAQNHARGALAAPLPGRAPDYMQCAERGIPLVFLCGSIDGVPADAVMADDFDGGLQAGRHLLGLGRGKPLAIGDGTPSSELRIQGFKEAFAERGAKFDAELALRCEEARLDANAAWRAIERKGCDAVFATNDVWATELYWFLKGKGVEIPGGIALMGFDDSEISKVAGVPLSTMAQPFRELGETAAKLLIERMEGSHCGEPKSIELKTRLAARESTVGP